MSSSTDATVVVLGYRGGIGAAILKKVIADGTWKTRPIGTLVLVDYLPTAASLDTARTEATSLLAKSTSPASKSKLTVLHWDAADLQSTKALCSAIDAATPVLDGLIVTTGLGFHGDLNKLSVDESHKALDRLLKVNCLGPALVIAHLAKKTRPNRLGVGCPTVVLMSSFSGLVGLPHRAAYCASKFALNGFAEGLQADMPHLRVVLVCPTSVDTGFRDAWKKQLGDVSTGVKDNVKADVTIDECVNAVCGGLQNRAVGPGVSYHVLKGWKVDTAAWAVRTSFVGDWVRQRVLKAANKL